MLPSRPPCRRRRRRCAGSISAAARRRARDSRRPLNATLVDRRAAVDRARLAQRRGRRGPPRPDPDRDRRPVQRGRPDGTGRAPVQDRAVRRRLDSPGSGHDPTFTPAEKLPGDTEFSVTIEPGFEDLAGNVATAGLDAWTFRTVGPPAVVSVEPVRPPTAWRSTARSSLTFDRLMDTRSVERAIEIVPAATYRPSWSGPVLTIGFDRPLAFGTTYTIDVGTEAADTDGSHLRAPFTRRPSRRSPPGSRPRPSCPHRTSPASASGRPSPSSSTGRSILPRSRVRCGSPRRSAGELRLAVLPDDTQPPDLARASRRPTRSESSCSRRPSRSRPTRPTPSPSTPSFAGWATSDRSPRGARGASRPERRRPRSTTMSRSCRRGRGSGTSGS